MLWLFIVAHWTLYSWIGKSTQNSVLRMPALCQGFRDRYTQSHAAALPAWLHPKGPTSRQAWQSLTLPEGQPKLHSCLQTFRHQLYKVPLSQSRIQIMELCFNTATGKWNWYIKEKREVANSIPFLDHSFQSALKRAISIPATPFSIINHELMQSNLPWDPQLGYWPHAEKPLPGEDKAIHYHPRSWTQVSACACLHRHGNGPLFSAGDGLGVVMATEGRLKPTSLWYN